MAQLCLAFAAVSLLFSWERGVVDSNNGFAADDGRVIFITLLITVVLIQVKFRPAWCGAGFVVAVAGRDIFNLAKPGPPDAGVGPWLVAAAALLAVALLLWELFAGVSANSSVDDQ